MMLGLFSDCSIYYPEVGGSFLPNDRDFGLIGSAVPRSGEIALPEDWVSIIKSARDPPFSILELKCDEFLDFKALLQDKGNKLVARKYKVVRYYSFMSFLLWETNSVVI